MIFLRVVLKEKVPIKSRIQHNLILSPEFDLEIASLAFEQSEAKLDYYFLKILRVSDN